MKNEIITELEVQNNKIRVMRVNDVDYISLTDLARYDNNDDPSGLIKQWMSKKDSFDYYGLWEELKIMLLEEIDF